MSRYSGSFRVQRSINNGRSDGFEAALSRRLESDVRRLVQMQEWEDRILGPPVPEATKATSPPTPEQQPEPSKA